MLPHKRQLTRWLPPAHAMQMFTAAQLHAWHVYCKMGPQSVGEVFTRMDMSLPYLRLKAAA